MSAKLGDVAAAVSNGSSRDGPEHLGFRVEEAGGDHDASEITDVRLS